MRRWLPADALEGYDLVLGPSSDPEVPPRACGCETFDSSVTHGAGPGPANAGAALGAWLRGVPS